MKRLKVGISFLNSPGGKRELPPLLPPPLPLPLPPPEPFGLEVMAAPAPWADEVGMRCSPRWLRPCMRRGEGPLGPGSGCRGCSLKLQLGELHAYEYELVHGEKWIAPSS